MKLSKSLVLACFAITLFGGVVGCAQEVDTRPQFEVASIKRNTTCGNRHGGGAPPSPGRLNLSCNTLLNLIQSAYVAFANGATLNLRIPEISGGPNWTESEMYDISAKAEGSAPLARMAGPMLQRLLEDRFKLRIHPEMKEAPVYYLTTAKAESNWSEPKKAVAFRLIWTICRRLANRGRLSAGISL